MKAEDLNIAMQYIDDKYLDTAEISEKDKTGMNRKKRNVLRYGVAACVMIVFGAGLTVYAANLFGIRSLFASTDRKLPDDAITYIQQESVSSASVESAEKYGWTCKVTESLCDSSNVMATILIDGGENYIVAPIDALETDPASVIGISGKQTLGEYAKAKGKKLLLASAAVSVTGDETIYAASRTEKNVSDSEMVILLETSKNIQGKKLDAVCNAYAREYDSEEIQEMEIPFTLTEAPLEDMMQLKPVNADAVPGIIMGEAAVQKTSLGVDVRIPVTVTDDKELEKIRDIAVDGLEPGKGGGLASEDGDIWYFHISMCKGDISDHITVRFYDWDGKMIGKIKFQ